MEKKGGGGGLSEPDCLLSLLPGPMTPSQGTGGNKPTKYGILFLIYHQLIHFVVEPQYDQSQSQV